MLRNGVVQKCLGVFGQTVKFDSRFDIDGGGNKDTIVFLTFTGIPNARIVAILDDFVVKDGPGAPGDGAPIGLHFLDVPQPSVSVAFEAARIVRGEIAGQQYVYGTDLVNDVFILDNRVEDGFSKADVITGFEQGTDKIRIDGRDNGIKFDNDSDWDGDGVKDTMIYVEEDNVAKGLAVLRGVSPNLTAQDFLKQAGTDYDGTVEEQDLLTLADII